MHEKLYEVVMGDKIRCLVHSRFVASQPCMITGREGDDIHSHHLLRADSTKGVATKSSDIWLVPLHYTQHDALHKHGDEVNYFYVRGLKYEEVKRVAMDLCERSPSRKIRIAMQQWRLENVEQ